jgi:RNA polymerase sigma-70 factor (ECF subfamily)
MSAGPLDELLEKLTSGDTAAAERVFAAYEPYLRKVVRRLLPAEMRARFDSVDIVQSVWSDVLVGFREAGWRFASPLQLRAFLVRLTRNRFIDRWRQTRASRAREEAVGSAELQRRLGPGQESPAEEAAARELWERLLVLCPAEHHGLLLLKRQGLSNAEAAARLGMHPGSVRRVLRELALRMAGGQGPAGGEPRAADQRLPSPAGASRALP